MSTPVTAAMIKELRERTGVGMAKCKEALETAHSDMELAIANLRKAGIATAVKKQGRDTNEGMIAIGESDKLTALVEINAETDFVVKNERFSRFIETIANEIAKTNPSNLEDFSQQKFSQDPELTIDQYRATVVQTIGENIQIKRFKVILKDKDVSIGVYSHMNGKIVAVAIIKGSHDEVALAKDIAMHIAAAAPEYLSADKVPESVIANEKDIARSLVKGKPEAIIEKIIDGKLNAFYDATCLNRQKFVKDDSLSITDVVNKRAKEIGKPLVLTDFIRWSVGQ